MADIKLKNPSGQEIIYNGVNVVSIPKAAKGYADFTDSGSAVLYEAQQLTSSQKAQARSNIDAAVVSVSATGTSEDEINYITVNGVEKKLAGGSTNFIVSDSNPFIGHPENYDKLWIDTSDDDDDIMAMIRGEY